MPYIFDEFHICFRDAHTFHDWLVISEANTSLRQSIDELLNMIFHDLFEKFCVLCVFEQLGETKPAAKYIYELIVCFGDVLVMF